MTIESGSRAGSQWYLSSSAIRSLWTDVLLADRVVEGRDAYVTTIVTSLEQLLVVPPSSPMHASSSSKVPNERRLW